MIFGEQTGWSGVENYYQAFNTNQGKNLGWWVEDQFVTVMTFGEQTGWSGVENDCQAFDTNQCKNLGVK